MSNVRLRRLAADYERMQSYVRRHPRVKLVQTEGSPPEKYQLQYVVRSLRQVGGELREQDSHMVEITLPRNYPRTPPQCRMLSPVFHPNVAPHAICVGDHWGAGEPLESIVIRIGEMLAFQSYNVKSPLNGDAARWVEQNLDRLPTDKVSMLAEEGAAPDEVNGHANGHAGAQTNGSVNGTASGPVAGAAQPSFAAFDEFTAAPSPNPAPPPPAAPQFSPPHVRPLAPPVVGLPPTIGPPQVAPPRSAVPPSVTPPPAAPAAAAPGLPAGRVKVTCPGCGKGYVISVEHRGRTAKCQNCQVSFTL